MEVMPSPREIRLARESSRSLAQNLPRQDKEVKIRVTGKGGHEADLILPAAAVKLLLDLLTEMAQGNAVTVMPLHAELTTQQAADLLNVSRPFLIKLLSEEKIPYKKVGRHRRVAARDVLAFKRTQESASEEAIDTLVSEGQKLKLGYDQG